MMKPFGLTCSKALNMMKFAFDNN